MNLDRSRKSAPLGLRYLSSSSPMAGPHRLGGKPQRRILPLEQPSRGIFARLFRRS